MDRKCMNNPNRFCYIYGNVVLHNRQAKITDFVKKAYCDHFGVKLGDQDKSFTPTVAVTREENLRDWRNGERKNIPYAISKVWWIGKDPITDCYSCKINIKEINRKNKHHVQYHDVPSAIRPIPHGPDLPVLEPDDNMEYSSPNIVT